MSKVVVSKYILDKIREFAEARIEGSKGLYSYRGKTSEAKMLEDIIIGTLGEYGVYQHLKSLGHKCSKPDLILYETRQKSFGADLKSEGYEIHVKSQSLASEAKYGRSWLFQRTDKLVSEPKDNEYMAFTNVNLETREVQILGFVCAKELVKQDLIGECRVKWFQKTKVAVYLDTLSEADIVYNNIGDKE